MTDLKPMDPERLANFRVWLHAIRASPDLHEQLAIELLDDRDHYRDRCPVGTEDVDPSTHTRERAEAMLRAEGFAAADPSTPNVSWLEAEGGVACWAGWACLSHRGVISDVCEAIAKASGRPAQRILDEMAAIVVDS